MFDLKKSKGIKDELGLEPGQRCNSGAFPGFLDVAAQALVLGGTIWRGEILRRIRERGGALKNVWLGGGRQNWRRGR